MKCPTCWTIIYNLNKQGNEHEVAVNMRYQHFGFFILVLFVGLAWGWIQVFSDEHVILDLCQIEDLREWKNNNGPIRIVVEEGSLPENDMAYIGYVDGLKGIEHCDNYTLDIAQHDIKDQVGDYRFAFYVTDRSGRTEGIEMQVSVKYDITPPVIHGATDLVVEINTEPDYTANISVTDNKTEQEAIMLFVDDESINIHRLGTYSLTYCAQDASGNESKVTVKVTVVDTQKPVFIRVPEHLIEVHEIPDHNFFIEQLEVTDNSLHHQNDYGVHCEADLSTVNPHQLGSYTVTYWCVDESGNEAMQTGTIQIVDRTPPEIIIDESAFKYLIHSGPMDYSYVISVKDNYSTLTFQDVIILDEQVRYDEPGHYPVTFIAIDESGNVQVVTKTLIVYDKDSPVFERVPKLRFQVGTDFDVLEGILVTDETDGVINDRVRVIDDFVDYTQVGTYPIYFVVTYRSGNTTIYETTITLVDDLPPVIIDYQPIVEVEVFNDTFDFLALIQVLDDYDPNPVITIEHSIRFDVLGEYELIYHVFDGSNNVTSLPIIVRIVDRQPPTLKTIGDIVIRKGDTINLHDYLEISDNYNAVEELNVQFFGSYDALTPGRYILKVVVTDQSGNQTEETFFLIVKEEEPPLPPSPSSDDWVLLSFMSDEKMVYVMSFTLGIFLIGMIMRLVQRKRQQKAA